MCELKTTTMTTNKRKIKVGDEFDIPVRVVRVDPNHKHPPGKNYAVEVRTNTQLTDWVCGATLEASRLVKAAPEPLKVGDIVTASLSVNINPQGYPLTLLAVDRDTAWVGNSLYGVHWTVSLEDLKRGG